MGATERASQGKGLIFIEIDSRTRQLRLMKFLLDERGVQNPCGIGIKFDRSAQIVWVQVQLCCILPKQPLPAL